MNIRIAVLLSIATLPLAAIAQTNQAPAPPPAQKGAAASQARIYGSQLMTDAERAEYRAKMRALKTNEEREALRLEHHKQMQARAKEKGVTLPDAPPPRGMGEGMGKGMGQAKGPGMDRGMRQGMAPGMGQGMHEGMHQGMHQPPAAGGQQAPDSGPQGNPPQPPPK